MMLTEADVKVLCRALGIAVVEMAGAAPHGEPSSDVGDMLALLRFLSPEHAKLTAGLAEVDQLPPPSPESVVAAGGASHTIGLALAVARDAHRKDIDRVRTELGKLFEEENLLMNQEMAFAQLSSRLTAYELGPSA